MLRLFVVFLATCLSLPAFAERNSGKKKRQKVADTMETEATDEVAERVKSAFFPDWPAPGFDWGLAPIVGYKLTRTQTDAGKSLDSIGEIGLQGYLKGIPIVPGNPGISMAPYGGYALGRIDSFFEAPGASEIERKIRYTRTWLGVNTAFRFKFYKHTLGLARGRRTFELEKSEVKGETDPDPIQNDLVVNDFGFLILPFVSGHYTLTYQKVFGLQYDDPYFVERDNWVHGRVWTDILSFVFDVGPGSTFVEEFGGDTQKGRTDYVKALSSAHLFWKIGMSAQAKYVYKVNNKQIGSFADILTADQALNEAPNVPMPEDSLVASFFFGIPNLFYGVGLGYRYNIQVLNYSEKNDTMRETTKDQGFGIFFQASL